MLSGVVVVRLLRVEKLGREPRINRINPTIFGFTSVLVTAEMFPVIPERIALVYHHPEEEGDASGYALVSD